MAICPIILLLAATCVKAGPDFVRSTTDVCANWLKADSTHIQSASSDDWLLMALKDPVPDHLMSGLTIRAYCCAWPVFGCLRYGPAWALPSASNTSKCNRWSATLISIYQP